VKELLSREGVPFTAYDVDEDDRAYDELVARGWRTVPLTLFGGRAVKGFDEAALMSAIAEWRAAGGDRRPSG
jgi:glutaredoxin-like protein NrdH